MSTGRCWPSWAAPTCASRSPMPWPGRSGWRRRPSGSTWQRSASSTFEAPDLERFPALRLAREALEAGGAAPIVLNAANEDGGRRVPRPADRFSRYCRDWSRSALAQTDAAAPRSIAEVIDIDRAAREQWPTPDERNGRLMLAQPPALVYHHRLHCAIGPLVFFHELGHYLGRALVRRRRGDASRSASAARSRLDRQARHPLEGRLAAAGRLCPVRRRHEPGEPAGAMPTISRRAIAGRAFHFKPWWQRFLIVLAGPVANFLLAIAIFAAFFAIVGIPRTPAVVGKSSPAAPRPAAGIRAGRPNRSRSPASATDIFEDIARDRHRFGPARRCQSSCRARRSSRRSFRSPSAPRSRRTSSARSIASACSACCGRRRWSQRLPAVQLVPGGDALHLRHRPAR